MGKNTDDPQWQERQSSLGIRWELEMIAAGIEREREREDFLCKLLGVGS